MTKNLKFIFLASFVFWCHGAFVTYVNSSLLESYVSQSAVSLIFALGSILNIVWILLLPKAIGRFGIVKVSSTTIFTTALFSFLVGIFSNPLLLIPLFIPFFSMSTAIVYSLDILVEENSTDEITGGIRGTLLTINNLAMAVLPLFVGILAEKYGFSYVYILASFILFISGLIIVLTQKKNTIIKSAVPNIWEAIKSINKMPDIRRVMTVNFLLQFFYALMVIYTPLYLANVLGFDWSTIGIILSIMLAPFVIFQLPAGRIADKWLGEKEMMITGLLIMGASTIIFAVLPVNTVVVVAWTLFCTRIGASIVEVMCDSYFFKQIDESNTNIVSFYRIMYPLAYILGPVVGATLIMLGSYQILFIILGFIMILGTLFTIRMVDTK